MQNGDLSNALTKRILVTADTFRTELSSVKKLFKVLPVVTKEYQFNRAALSRFYLFADRTSYTLELVSFSDTNEELEEMIEKIEELGTNPFRYFTAYESVEHLVTELPYRPEVAGVMDIPTRLLRYGHWGMDLA